MTIIMNNLCVFILDIIKGAAMQASMWAWEMHMIIEYGLDWSYKEF